MFELKRWYLSEWNETYIVAHGYVFNNPKFTQGIHIHTSPIKVEDVTVDEEQEQIIVVTRSGSHYVLKFAEMKFSMKEIIEACFDKLNISRSILDKCYDSSVKQSQNTLKEVAKRLQPKELYLKMGGSSVIDGYFKREDGELIKTDITYHPGMFHDSVLVRCFGEVDFRYFPEDLFDAVMRPYHWSDGLDRIIIHNIGEKLIFRGSNEDFICESGEEMTIESKDYCGEGLVSPDCVNGKSMLIIPNQDKESDTDGSN